MGFVIRYELPGAFQRIVCIEGKKVDLEDQAAPFSVIKDNAVGN